MLPNFLIVGAAKSGTTSLHYYLSQHPDVFMPKWKELSFFIKDPFEPLHRVKKLKLYSRLFSKAKTQSAIGEASTGYLYDPSAPAYIIDTLGKIKIIICLRNPVEMIYSLYNQQLRREGENIEPFESALEAEDHRMKDLSFRKTCYGWHANYYYFHRGLYFQQVKRYLDTFGDDYVMILLYEDLVADPVKTIQSIFRFLNIDDTFIPDIKVMNPAGRIVAIPEFWTDIGLFIKTLSFVFSTNLFRKIPLLIKKIWKKPPPVIQRTTAARLTKKFKKDICELEKLLGRDLSVWKNKYKDSENKH